MPSEVTKHSSNAPEPRMEMPSVEPTDPFQWEKFDTLFDQVFSPTKIPTRPAGYISHNRSASDNAIPGGFAVGGKIVEDTNGTYHSDDDFGRAWNDALRRTKRSTVTTTKRRIIRHTPASIPKPTTPIISPRPIFANPERPLFAHLAEGSFNSGSSSHSHDGDHHSNSASSSSSSAASSRSPSPQLRRERSQFDFHHSEDSPVVTATFEMPSGLTKDQINVSYSTLYSAEKVTVSWKSVTVSEMMEEGRLVRERKERTYTRTLPLPLGTKFENVHASLANGRLTVTYPKGIATIHHHGQTIGL